MQGETQLDRSSHAYVQVEDQRRSKGEKEDVHDAWTVWLFSRFASERVTFGTFTFRLPCSRSKGQRVGAGLFRRLRKQSRRTFVALEGDGNLHRFHLHVLATSGLAIASQVEEWQLKHGFVSATSVVHVLSTCKYVTKEVARSSAPWWMQ